MVQFRANATGIVVALATALALCGCANVDYDNKDAWFAKPFELVSRKGGYTFSELQESKERARPITASDLVDGKGSCPTPQASQQAPATAAANQAPGVPPAADAGSLLGGGVSLGMSECDIVFRAGSPNAVQIGKAPNGDRTAVLTFNSGPRPGIYHFAGGALTEVERGQVAPPAPPSAQAVKKKPASPSKASKQAAKE
jgi:hypothetical protein